MSSEAQELLNQIGGAAVKNPASPSKPDADPAVDAVAEQIDVGKVIKSLIDSDFSGSNEEQGKASQLFKGLAFSDDPNANKFMKALDDFTSSLNAADFE